MSTAIRKHLSDLNNFADAFISAESSRQLVEHLEMQLKRIGAIPARLHLLDESSMTLYCACAFDCEVSVDEISADALTEIPDHYYMLYSLGDPIGVLEVDPQVKATEEALTQLCSILGPALKSVEHQEVSLRELRYLHEEMQQFTNAGELLAHVEVDVLLVRILETMMTAVKAQVGAIFTAGADGVLQPQVVWGFTEDHVAQLYLKDGRLLADAVFEEQREFCLYGDAVAEHIDCERFPGSLTGLLAIPISGKQIKHGIVLLANPEHVFDNKVKRIGLTVRDMAAIAMDNASLVRDTVDKERLARDVEIAQSVQTSMYPSTPYDENKLYVAGRSVACDETGGDYYTYIEHNDELFVVIGDVTGHGLGAALYTTMAHAIVHQELRAGVGVQAGSNGISMALKNANSERFMTAVLMNIDYTHRQFCYVSAGHNPILWLHQGEIRWLESNGLPLGIMLDVPCVRSKMYDYAPGDYLILYTDGFIEAFNPQGEDYGEERFAQLMLDASKSDPSVEELMDVLYNDVNNWLAGASADDDLTVTIIKCQAEETEAQS